MAAGSGFKCGSAVWRARRSIRQTHACCQGEMLSYGLPKLPGKQQIGVTASDPTLTPAAESADNLMDMLGAKGAVEGVPAAESADSLAGVAVVQDKERGAHDAHTRVEAPVADKAEMEQELTSPVAAILTAA